MRLSAPGGSWKSIRKLAPAVLVCAALLFAGSRFVNITATLDHLEDYNWSLAPWVLALGLCYYLLKAFRWHYYLSIVGIHQPVARSVLVYLAGQWFAFTPAGEFARAYMLRRYHVDPVLASSTVTMQIIVDLLSLALIGSLTLLRFHEYAVWILLLAALLLGSIALFVHGLSTGRLSSLPMAGRFWDLVRGPWRRYYEGSRAMLTWRPLLIGVAMGVPTIGVGAATLFIVCLGYQGLGVDLMDSAYVYSVSQGLGAISMLPHGVGAVESSSLVLFGRLGMDLSYAAAAITLFRLATVIWSMLVGGVALGVLHLANRRQRDYASSSAVYDAWPASEAEAYSSRLDSSRLE